MAPTQTYANHRRLFPPYHLFVVPILTMNVVIAAWDVIRSPSARGLWWLAVGMALVGLALVSRASAIIVQNRLIGLEMRLRLTAVLGPDLRNHIGELTLCQIVGLRFAADAELPGLVQRCLSGELRSADDVKRQIKEWRPDFVRA